MKMFYDDFEVGDTIGYDENWDGRLTGRMIEHVLTEISLKDIKTWEKKENPHNMRIIKKGTNKTTQQIIDEDFDGGLTMGQITPEETLEENVFDVEALEEQIKIANKQKDEFAIEFAEWLSEKERTKFQCKSYCKKLTMWFTDKKGLGATTKELLEQFKKEQGL